MTWQPVSRSELDAILLRDLAEGSPDLRRAFEGVRIAPEKWSLHPWGDPGGGFWVVATRGDRALWWNDIEDGFNVSRFERRGEIASEEYWCNQDSLGWAMPLLLGDEGIRLGPPQPIPMT